jgi:hypothetical protein
MSASDFAVSGTYLSTTGEAQLGSSVSSFSFVRIGRFLSCRLGSSLSLSLWLTARVSTSAMKTTTLLVGSSISIKAFSRVACVKRFRCSAGHDLFYHELFYLVYVGQKRYCLNTSLKLGRVSPKTSKAKISSA